MPCLLNEIFYFLVPLEYHVSTILGQHLESLNKGTFRIVLPRNTEKRALSCQILQGAASNYMILVFFIIP